jgi:hypothetical protein
MNWRNGYELSHTPRSSVNLNVLFEPPVWQSSASGRGCGLHGLIPVAVSLAPWNAAIECALPNPVQQSISHSEDLASYSKQMTYVDTGGLNLSSFVPGAGNVFPAHSFCLMSDTVSGELFGSVGAAGRAQLRDDWRPHETRSPAPYAGIAA